MYDDAIIELHDKLMKMYWFDKIVISKNSDINNVQNLTDNIKINKFIFP